MGWGLALLTTLTFTVPGRGAIPDFCDSVRVACDESGICDTTEIHQGTRLGTTRIWWWPRWSLAPVLLREKSAAGLEGRTDTVQVPSDTIATVFLTVVSAGGVESCRSNMVTVNAPLAVEGGGVVVPTTWYDVTGRRLRDLDGLSLAEVRGRAPSGILYLRSGSIRRTIAVVR